MLLTGPTERTFLANIAKIVDAALPTKRLCSYLTTASAEDYLLKKIMFCEEMKLVCRVTYCLIIMKKYKNY
jgi:hypothetical protein